MNHVERFRAVMDFQPVDRLPRWEWAMWWDETIANWKEQGLPRRWRACLTLPNILGSIRISSSGSRPPTTRSRPCSITWKASSPTWTIPAAAPEVLSGPSGCHRVDGHWAKRQAAGEVVVWITLEGYFWFPRTLMGFTKISLAFYDQPELLHQINQDLTDFNLRILDAVEKVCVPTFATIAEDMSYNNGPMISERHFDEFVAPYYRQIIPRLQEKNIVPLVDTDGDVTMMVPWLMREGIRGVLPLERQAGVEGMDLRAPIRGCAWLATTTRWSWTRAKPRSRRVRTTAAADAFRRFHPECRPPDAAPYHHGPVSALPPTAGRVHGTLTRVIGQPCDGTPR